ncbi:MAG: DUF4336 domain-containing protein [Acidobacteria bacterium]|nr:MAG: DUF4336 domain-containing protein [Acidobacteriota bacterium]REK08802.1 MAG: DUF4336 domain-containing protein [Acidobacteriota bacterium]
MSQSLRKIADDLFTADAPLRFAGAEIGTRMTAVRLPEGDLVLISPVPARQELVAEVSALGRVAHLVAPNKMHHLYIGQWHEAFPDASLYVAPGLEEKRRDLRITEVLGSEPESSWAEELDQVFVRGFPFANEVVFFHRSSATLILTDIAFNIGPESPLLTRIGFRLLNGYGRLTPSLLERLLVRDRKSFREDLERIFEWPFDRVVVTHGQIVESGGREQLRRGYSWVLGD